ncbi:hypothetical protein C7U60_05585 [Mesorhizobium plurifarium]|nr:hypothetical protein C7U60_05585 [Mesorhizobium plurifarium]
MIEETHAKRPAIARRPFRSCSWWSGRPVLRRAFLLAGVRAADLSEHSHVRIDRAFAALFS